MGAKGGRVVRVACPGCGAQESHCREVLPACRKIAADQRRLYASANGSELETLRAENEALRAELARRGGAS